MDQNEQHSIAMRRMRHDAEFINCIKLLLHKWPSLSLKEKLLVRGIYDHHLKSRCLTDTQRSAIIALHLKHSA